MKKISVVIIKDVHEKPFYAEDFFELSKLPMFLGFSSGKGDGRYSICSGNTTIVVHERHLDCQRKGQTEEEVAAMTRANLVYFNLAAEQLGLYKTEMDPYSRVIYICATPSDELNKKLRDLFSRYCEAYSKVPYEVFTLHNMIGDGDKSQLAKIAAFPRQKIEMDYNVNESELDKKLEDLGVKVLPKNLLLGSIMLCATSLAVAEPYKT